MTTDREWGECWEIALGATGRYAQQDVSELTQALVELRALKPKLMAEIGSATGGTLYAWTRVCPEVYGISLSEPQYANAQDYGADVRLGDSHSNATRTWLTGKLDGRPLDALFVDGDHTAEGVASDWADYGSLVRAGGLVIFHDVCNEAQTPAVVAFWNELARTESCHVIVNLTKADRAGIGIVVQGTQATTRKAASPSRPVGRTAPIRETGTRDDPREATT